MNDRISGKAAEQERGEVKSRKFKYGTLAAIFSAVFVIAVIAVNLFVGYMTDRFVFEIDLTSEKLFEISDDTKEVIAGLKEPITITVLSEETAFQTGYIGSIALGNIYEIFQRYVALGNGMITVRYLNPLTSLGEMERYNAKMGGNLLTNDILIESAKRFKKIAPQNLLTPKVINQNGQRTTNIDGTVYYVGLRAEQRISSAILFVTSDEVAQAAWLYGHNENEPVNELETILSYANYDVIRLNLLQEEIADDISLLIMNDPMADYDSRETEKISAFLERGGDLIVALGPENTNHPKLDLLFDEWGVKYSRNIIYDSEQSISGYPGYVVPNVLQNLPFTQSLPQTIPMIPAGRPIELTGSQTSMVELTPLLASSGTSYAKRYEDAMVGYGQNPEDIVGPFNMAVIAEALIYDKSGETPTGKTSIFFTNAGMVTQTALQEPAFLNRVYIGLTLDYMSDYTEGLVIPDKDFSTAILSIQTNQAHVVLFLLVFGLPALLIAAGVAVQLRRRHK
jgi:ABC-2 type transport system permease protein